LGVITQKFTIPKLVKKEKKDIVENITSEKFDELVKESELLIDENHTIFKRLSDIDVMLLDINKHLAEAKDEREWFNRDTIQRLNMMSEEIRKTNLIALEASVYTDGPILGRMYNFIAYLKLGGNGNCLDFACKNLILNNKSIWKSLYQQINDTSNVLNKELYSASLEQIRTSVFL
jgi:Fe-S cluster biosynthesis and repair protein YggX